MKITASSDWRDSISFDEPVLVADLVPGEATRCSACGTASDPRPRTELWAVKHRHPHNHSGYVRFYCREHVPVIERAATQKDARAARSAAHRERVAPARRSAPAQDPKPRAMCTDCFVEVSATGVCGMCGKPA